VKKFLNVFFVTLGIIFFILILIAIYLFVTDPLNLKPLIFDQDKEVVESTGGNSVSIDQHPLLSESQEKTLETFGIDPADLPTEITPEQEACFEDKLGIARVVEIKAGDSPTATEYFKARDCI
jgi:DNA-directed RNA polymerase subunit H (RpoH/RPB5)